MDGPDRDSGLIGLRAGSPHGDGGSPWWRFAWCLRRATRRARTRRYASSLLTPASWRCRKCWVLSGWLPVVIASAARSRVLFSAAGRAASGTAVREGVRARTARSDDRHLLLARSDSRPRGVGGAAIAGAVDAAQRARAESSAEQCR